MNTSLFSSENINKFILPYYNLQNSSISTIKEKNTIKHRIIYKIDNGRNIFSLKKVYYPSNELLYVYSAIEWLHRNEITVPQVMPTISNGRYVNLKNNLFILTPWIKGSKCNLDNKNHIISSSELLATIHAKSKSFSPILGSFKRECFSDFYISTLKHFEQLMKLFVYATINNDNFSKIFLKYFKSNLYLAERSLYIASKIDVKDLSVSLCHGDFVSKNIIFDNDNIPWIIDFDKCKLSYCSSDIGYFLRRLLRRESTFASLSSTLSFLKAYNNINTISKSDLKFITSYITFPQKYYKLSKNYYKNSNILSKDTLCKSLENTSYKVNYKISFVDNLICTLEKSNWKL